MRLCFILMSNKKKWKRRELKNSDDGEGCICEFIFTCCCCLIEHSNDDDDMNLFTNTKRSRIKFDIKKDPFLLCHAFSFFFSFELFQLGCFYCLQMCLNLMPINNADVCGKNLKLQEVLFSLLFPSKDAM